MGQDLVAAIHRPAADQMVGAVSAREETKKAAQDMLETFEREVEPPWSRFRDAALDIARDYLNALTELEQAEEEADQLDNRLDAANLRLVKADEEIAEAGRTAARLEARLSEVSALVEAVRISAQWDKRLAKALADWYRTGTAPVPPAWEQE